MQNQLALAKLAIHLIAGAGVSKIVNDIIVNNTNIETAADAAKVWAGSIVIGSMAAEAGSKHVNHRIDQVVTWYESRKAATTPTS